MTDTDRTPAPSTPQEVAELYFDSWQQRDMSPLAAVLAADVTFDGPLASLTGRADCLDGLVGLARATTRLTVRRRLADHSDVMTWFDLAVGSSEPTPVVNWCEVADGLITHIRVTFDPRGMLADG